MLKHKLINIVFIFALVLCGVLTFVKYDLMPYFSENRVLNKLPTEINTTFPTAFSSFVGDNFGFRKPLLASFFNIKMKILNSDLGLPVTLGEDGWLFIREEIPFYQKTIKPDLLTLESFRNNLDLWCEYSKENGAEFYLLIGPNKSTIYPEKMNNKFSLSNNDSMIDIVKGLDYKCNFQIIDVRELLINNKTSNLYYKWGTHWNDSAGQIVWTQIKKDIQKKQPLLIWPMNNQTETRLRPARPLEDSAWAWFGQNDPFVDLIPEVRSLNSARPLHAPDANEIKVLAIGDSFLQFMFNSAKVLFPYYFVSDLDTENIVYEDINKSTYAWLFKGYGKNLNLDAVPIYRPNVVILEVVERNLQLLSSLKRPPSNRDKSLKNILGFWRAGESQANILLTEGKLIVINERGEKAFAKLSDGKVFVPEWGVIGIISDDTNTLNWQNGASWVR
jgi:hypothetical protein